MVQPFYALEQESNLMGQAKQRGSYEDRLKQALAANATLERQLSETASPMLKTFIKQHGLQRFRMAQGIHLTLSGPSGPTGQEDEPEQSSSQLGESAEPTGSQTT
jgi:hypothetical protein